MTPPAASRAKPAEGPPASSSADALDRFTDAWEHFFRAARNGRRRFVGNGTLTIPQYLLVEPLAADGPRMVGELAEHAGVSGPTATRMLDGLVRAGWVQRHQSERDRRCVEVELTAAGRAELEARRDEVRAYRGRLFEALEPAERVAAERLLRRLAAAIDEL